MHASGCVLTHPHTNVHVHTFSTQVFTTRGCRDPHGIRDRVSAVPAWGGIPRQEYLPHKLHVQRWLHGPRGRAVRAGGQPQRLNASGLVFLYQYN